MLQAVAETRGNVRSSRCISVQHTKGECSTGRLILAYGPHLNSLYLCRELRIAAFDLSDMQFS